MLGQRAENEARLNNARADFRAGNIERWQYEDIIKSVMRSEIEQHVIIYHNGVIDLAPKSALYVPFEAA